MLDDRIIIAAKKKMRENEWFSSDDGHCETLLPLNHSTSSSFLLKKATIELYTSEIANYGDRCN
jgi:hypothetical protein